MLFLKKQKIMEKNNKYIKLLPFILVKKDDICMENRNFDAIYMTKSQNRTTVQPQKPYNYRL